MTTYEKSVQIMTDVLQRHQGEAAERLARRCLEAMRQKRIVPHTMRASAEMFTRFHAHCRHLGNVTGRGYDYYYNMAIKAAVRTEDWPVKVYPRRVRLDNGDIVEVDVPIPESSTKATNGQLLAAYQVIQDEAARHGITLPEE